jgi:hypothetical protein
MGLLLKLKEGDTSLKSLRYGHDRPGGGDSGQPFIKTPIPDGSTPTNSLEIDGFVRGGTLAPKAAKTDSQRLSNFLFNFKNPSGFLFTAKQNVLSRVSPKTETSFGAGYGGSKRFKNLASNQIRKGPAGVNGGIYTPLSTIAQAGVGWLGTHLNKQGLDPTGAFPSAAINKYQQVAFENNRSVNNAHEPDVPLTLLRKKKRLAKRLTRLVDKSEDLDNKGFVAKSKFDVAEQRYYDRLNAPYRLHYLTAENLQYHIGGTNPLLGNPTLKEEYFKPDFQSRQLQNLGITGQMVANTNNPVPAGSYPIVPSGNPNNVQGITFSQQGPTGRIKNRAYNNLLRKRVEIRKKLSKTWEEVIEASLYRKQHRLGKRVSRLESRKENTDRKIFNTDLRLEGVQSQIDAIREGDKVYENRLLKLWNKTGLDPNNPYYQSPVLLTYTGGPGSALGIGSTTIKFATLNDGVTPYRTGTNSRRFQTDEEGFYSRFSKTQNYKWHQIFSFGVSDRFIGSDYNVGQENEVDLFGQNWWDNFSNPDIKTVGPQKLAPWKYSTPDNKTQLQIDTEYTKTRLLPYAGAMNVTKGGDFVNYEDTKEYENGKKYNIRQLGDAGTNAAKRSLKAIHPLMQYGEDGKKPSNFKVKRQDGKLTDFIQFTIGVQGGSPDAGTTHLNFPCFLNGVSDSYSAKHKSLNYMGRGESFYQYQGFNRSINVSFVVVAQNRAEIGNMYKKLNFLASSVAPSYTSEGYMTGNIGYLTIGDLYYNIPGIINGFSFSVPEDVTWDIGIHLIGKDSNISLDGEQTPMMIKVDGFKFTPLYDEIPTVGTKQWIGVNAMDVDKNDPERTMLENINEKY